MQCLVQIAISCETRDPIFHIRDDMMQGILIDLDGVLYIGDTAIDGAMEVLRWIDESAIPHLFVTNTTSRPRRAIVKKLAGMGIAVDAGQVLTPAVAAGYWLQNHVEGPLALFVPEATREEFSSFPQLAEDTQAAAVILGDMGRDWDFETLNRAFRLLMQTPAPAFVALGMTRYWLTEQGLQLDAGPFVSALEYATGQEATVLGKPARAFYEAAAAMLGISGVDLVMIGDDIQGDVRAAQASGMRAILVKTGKFSDTDLEQGIAPDTVLDSIANLPDWWAQQN